MHDGRDTQGQSALELFRALLPELARRNPGILERMEVRLTARAEATDDPVISRSALDARELVRRFEV